MLSMFGKKTQEIRKEEIEFLAEKKVNFVRYWKKARMCGKMLPEEIVMKITGYVVVRDDIDEIIKYEKETGMKLGRGRVEMHEKVVERVEKKWEVRNAIRGRGIFGIWCGSKTGEEYENIVIRKMMW
ncbi:hypothetical protein DFJ73DRAFT_765325 [Zopfochytrium polystomum]|nr:hypothetical protein DFJ73DRAFT_768956 [Zopfochytrium polystomum]KAI9330594.1 hypothetical protein DFJ73DRAFT_765325 [Zopfochytrium polystomum]